MGKYLEISKRLNAERRQDQTASLKVINCELSEISELSPRVESTENSWQAERVLTALQTIHDTQSQNPGDTIVRVLLTDWRAATGLNDLAFWRVMGELEQAGQIIREHGYVRPADEVTR